jgi:hypothetical protein
LADIKRKKCPLTVVKGTLVHLPGKGIQWDVTAVPGERRKALRGEKPHRNHASPRTKKLLSDPVITEGTL